MVNKNNTIWWVAGGAVIAYFLLKKNAVPAGTVTVGPLSQPAIVTPSGGLVPFLTNLLGPIVTNVAQAQTQQSALTPDQSGIVPVTSADLNLPVTLPANDLFM